MKTEIIQTADGSHSLYIRELDEHYHSKHGAIQESKHVFIDAGLKHIISQAKYISAINILEVGVGTGLNMLLTFLETQNSEIKINYTAIEAHPVKSDMLNQLNYVSLLSESAEELESLHSIFNKIHTSEWEKEISLSEHFVIHKIKNTLQEIKLEDTYDLIYFDAFGPRVQPELWTEEIFSKIFSATKSDGCLVTYCAKGEVKRTLKKVGFIVESLPGPPGKREMVRAVRIN
jgi:tRNA U34 5-methylaminomethyl-2-thiouridine-forming methyltransferase MnmC